MESLEECLKRVGECSKGMFDTQSDHFWNSYDTQDHWCRDPDVCAQSKSNLEQMAKTTPWYTVKVAVAGIFKYDAENTIGSFHTPVCTNKDWEPLLEEVGKALPVLGEQLRSPDPMVSDHAKQDLAGLYAALPNSDDGAEAGRLLGYGKRRIWFHKNRSCVAAAATLIAVVGGCSALGLLAMYYIKPPHIPG